MVRHRQASGLSESALIHLLLNFDGLPDLAGSAARLLIQSYLERILLHPGDINVSTVSYAVSIFVALEQDVLRCIYGLLIPYVDIYKTDIVRVLET